jgi:beta-glucanase (GH16 family)
MPALRLFLLIVPLSFLFAACQSGGSSPSGSQALPLGQSGNWKMIFHDDFDGNSLDTSKWTTCYFNFKVGKDDCDHDQGERELYQPANVSVSNGILTLSAEKKSVDAANGQTYDYTSGMISTGPSSSSGRDTRFSFKYGYIEMRAKVPSGQGLWPAFWTLPTNLSWPPEIDVFEIIGNAPDVINMHYHYPDGSDEGGDDGKTWQGPNFSSDWHTYAVDWEPDAITWYVDGVERRTYTDTSNITSDPMYLIANLAVGGDWPGDPDGNTTFPALYQIDYVHVWQKQS